MDYFEAVELRHSYRGNYTDAPVPDEDIIKIVDAGLRAPSGCNRQTTDFIIVTNADLRAKLANILVCDAVRTAPVLIVGITEKITFDFGIDCEIEDYSAAVENILLAATAMGYASCWFDGTTRLDGRDDAMAELLGVAPGKRVRTLLPIGIPAVKGTQAPRKPFDERVEWKR